MKRKVNLIHILALYISSCGCSTLNNPTLLTGVGSFLGCSVIGSAVAPEDEKSEMHGLLWGASCSSVGMAISEIIIDNKEKQISSNALQRFRSNDSLDELKIKNSILHSHNYENLDYETKEKLKGKWTVYKLDNWIIDRGKVKHEDLEIEFE